MPLDPQKIEAAKKIFGVNDADIQRIVTSGGQPQVAPSAPVQQPQQQGDFMDRLLQSRVLPIGGAILGGGVGALAGPVTGVAGAAAGAAGGDVIRKEAARLKGTPGVNPAGATQNVAQTGKEAAVAALSQTTGAVLGYGLKFLKPGTVTTLIDKLNDVLAKKTGFGKIPSEVLETRFMNEVIPKALRFSQGQGEDVAEAGSKLLGQKVSPTRVFDAEELNFLRKNLNAIGEGAEGLKKAILNGLAEIVREEQIKLAPATGVSLPASRLARQIPEALKAFWPTRMALMATDAARSFGSGIMSKFAKFGGGPLIGGTMNQQEQ